MSLLPAQLARLNRLGLVMLALCAVWGWMAPARADVYSSTDTTFDVTGQFASGSALSGTLTLNSGSQFGSGIAQFSAADLTVSGPDNLHLNNIVSQLIFAPGVYDIQVANPNYGPSNAQSGVFFLSIPPTIVNSQQFSAYSGGPILPTIGSGLFSGVYTGSTVYNGSYDKLTSGYVGSGPSASNCATALSGAGSKAILAPGGAISSTMQPEAMTGIFVPGGGLSLAQAAAACGYTTFAWKQQVTGSTAPPLIDPAGHIVPTPFQDPPSFGANGCQGYPYYYDITSANQSDACKKYNLSSHEFTSSELPSLSPSNLCIPPTQGTLGSGSTSSTILNFCDTPTMPDGDIKFFDTDLVGVLNGGGVAILDDWTWYSTFSGVISNNDGLPYGPGGTGLFADFDNVDPNSGSGGVTLLTVNGVAVSVPEPQTWTIVALCLIFVIRRNLPSSQLKK